MGFERETHNSIGFQQVVFYFDVVGIWTKELDNNYTY